ncbi:MAG: hypothetical protein CBC09_06850 [Cellvibrionales bacterium TMED49]|nr:NAD-glutamate dehydrogenase [Porticoccaceae bacterium]OUU37344.1 MAG: hypothetical protein CBC09_06850 [Cellvibrionales bacterium TMED49]
MDLEKNNNSKQHLLQALRALSLQHLEMSEVSLFDEFACHAIQQYLDKDYLNRPLETIFWSLYGLFQVVSNYKPKSSTNEDKHYGRVRVFNPKRHLDGWEAVQTIILINCADQPFLVDSLRIGLNSEIPIIHSLRSSPIWVIRNDKGIPTGFSEAKTPSGHSEAVITIEIEALDDSRLESLKLRLGKILSDVDLVVSDYEIMRSRLAAEIMNLETLAPPHEDLVEDIAFLNWMRDGAFVFLGVIAFELKNRDGIDYLCEAPDSRHGLFRRRQSSTKELAIDQLDDDLVQFYQICGPVIHARASRRSHIHRHNYSNYVVVKRFDESGLVIGEIRFMGLHTSQFHRYSTDRIPLLRKRINALLLDSGLICGSHDYKGLVAIADAFPREELLQMPRQHLLEVLMEVLHGQQRNASLVFAHRDIFKKFLSCFVFIPRTSFNSEVRAKIQRAFEHYLGADESNFVSFFVPESTLVRVYFLIPTSPGQFLKVDMAVFEALVQRIISDWREEFKVVARNEFSSPRSSSVIRNFSQGFSITYREIYSPPEALRDVVFLEHLIESDGMVVDVGSLSDRDGPRLKLFHRETPLPLSDLVPILENMGLRVLLERPHEIKHLDEGSFWKQDLSLGMDSERDLSEVGEELKLALSAVWAGKCENDRFNRLVITSGLDWRSTSLLRAYSRYLKQLRIPFSQEFIAETLIRHGTLSSQLKDLFCAMLSPAGEHEQNDEEIDLLTNLINKNIEGVEDINEDSVFRAFLCLIRATRRTNFYQTTSGEYACFISLKFVTTEVTLAPEPRPAIEVFVYSPEFEGVHLRGGKVSRGGLRWSDRLEDYRTEILGLMKAQQVKNALIVPSGAKGGFVVKNFTRKLDPDAWREEGIAFYKLYIQALLDLTDNRKGDEIFSPRGVLKRDGSDPYLVVAADKGTADFSDIANELAHKNGYWLGDAFASGGSNGYDHKEMGITARGAWVAVERHFREMGVDIQTIEFDVIGIGDMSGDVFGNGMLLSPRIRLLAAFNHKHIFVDPKADAAVSFEERRRLFSLAGSQWTDFDDSVLSQGGRIYSRNTKLLELTPEIMERFSIEVDTLTPNELIKKLLVADVDLLWNGGVGTYVKSETETNTEVGDKVNDALRVNGSQLRCRVIGEGGNLGMTQLGRIEFSLHGGLCNTDFIDNSAGVDCSDHEVNIKIMLDTFVRDGSMQMPDRNTLLNSMTSSVADKVLKNNSRQTQSISIALRGVGPGSVEYQRFMHWLEEKGELNRQLEFLPSEEVLSERAARQQMLWTRPELAVLLCYSKVMVKEALLKVDLLSDAWLSDSIEQAFPREIIAVAGGMVIKHKLALEIAATQLANDMINRFGLTFFYHVAETTGGNAAQIVRAFTVVVHVFGIDELWKSIEDDYENLASSQQLDLFSVLIKLVRRGTRWFLINYQDLSDCGSIIEKFANPMHQLLEHWIALRPEKWNSKEGSRFSQLAKSNRLSALEALTENMFFSLGIIKISLNSVKSVENIAKDYTFINEELYLDKLMSHILALQPHGHWQSMAQDSYVDQLAQHKHDLMEILIANSKDQLCELPKIWKDSEVTLISRWKKLMTTRWDSGGDNFSEVTVAIAQLHKLLISLKRRTSS